MSVCSATKEVCESEIFLKGKCSGCRKCLKLCPAARHTNELPQSIMSRGCISCGKCLDACPFHTIDYRDDTLLFIEDLKKGEKISLMVAPAVLRHFSSPEKLFGFLKLLGVESIHNVILYADIAIWAYSEQLRRNPGTGFIASPCAAIIRYIQLHKPELLSHVMPVYSPMHCTAVFLKKYTQAKGKLAFLSPCIAKRTEMRSVGDSMVTYNITIGRLKKYIADNGIDIEHYPASDFDDLKNGDGVTLGLYGGVSESIAAHIPSLSHTKVSGTNKAYDFLENYAISAKNGLKLPDLSEVYNCEDPCDGGPGCGKLCPKSNARKTSSNDRTDRIDNATKYSLSNKAFAEFDMELDIDDFLADYSRTN